MAETTYCGHCQENIVTRNWKRHLSTNKHKNKVAGILKNEPEGDEKYSCRWPGCTNTKGFSSRTSLANHTKRHKEGPKPVTYLFNCDTCGIPIRDQNHADHHIKAKCHKKEIIQNHPEFLTLVPGSHLRSNIIDAQKQLDMITKMKIVKNAKPVKRVDGEPVDVVVAVVVEKYVPISEADFNYDDFVQNDYQSFVDNSDIHQLVLDKGIRYLIQSGMNNGVVFENSMAFNAFKQEFDDGDLDLTGKKEFLLQMQYCFEETAAILAEEEEANGITPSCHPIELD